MDFSTIASRTGMSTDEVRGLFQKIDSFNSTLTPAEKNALNKGSDSILTHVRADKRSEIQNFLETRLAAAGQHTTGGICVVLVANLNE